MTEPDKKQQKRKKLLNDLEDWKTDQTKAYQTYIKTSAVGLEFGLAIAIGGLLGYFVDKYFSISPYGLLVGIAIGFIAGAKRLWIFAKKYLEKNGSRDDE